MAKRAFCFTMLFHYRICGEGQEELGTDLCSPTWEDKMHESVVPGGFAVEMDRQLEVGCRVVSEEWGCYQTTGEDGTIGRNRNFTPNLYFWRLCCSISKQKTNTEIQEVRTSSGAVKCLPLPPLTYCSFPHRKV